MGSASWKLFQLFLLTLTLALMVYALIVALVWTDPGLGWDARFEVTHMASGGPAEQAGVQVGDQVLLIGGHSVDDWHLPVTRWRPGKSLTVVAQRDRERLTWQLSPQRLSLVERMETISPIIIAFAFWATGALMLGRARWTPEIRLLRAFGLLGSSVLTAGNLSGMGLVWAGHLFGVLAYMYAALILHFHLTLPDAQLQKWRRPIIVAIYALCAVLALPYLLLGPISYQWRAGWGARGLRVALVISLLGSLAWLGYNYATTRPQSVRRRLRLIVLGTGWAFVPLIVLSLLPELLGGRFVPFPFTMIPLVLVPITYWYACMRFDLLRVDLVLNRSLVYLLTAFTLTLGYVVVMQLFGQLLVDELPIQEPVRLLLVVVVIVATPALFSRFQRVVDRLFYGGWYDYRSVVSDISRRLSSVPDRHTLETLLLGHTADILWVHKAALLLPESHLKERLVGQAHGMLETDVSLLTLNISGDLGRYLRTLHCPIEAPRLRQKMAHQSLYPSEARLLHSEAIRWWVPVVSEDGLVGLLLLGARFGNECFDADDLRILGTLADQAGLAIRNILLLEELQLHIMEIENSHRILEQMHEQLLLGREAERKRLAREIHDNPIHCLIAFRYRLRECAAQTDDDDLRTSLEQLREEISVLLNELRGLCRQLRPPLLDAFGLASAIRAYGDELAERSGLSIHSEIDEEEDWYLPEEIAVSLFRVHQETLLNVVKHARANQVTIRLSRAKSWVTLEIKDDGVGFIVPDSLEKLAADGHFGLLGIRERVELLSGTFELTSQSGNGTTLHVQVPQNRK